MKEILFGAAYYLEYMPYDRLKEDLDMMQQAGMNTIRIAESTWSTLEPTDGEFDFSYIDRVLRKRTKEKDECDHRNTNLCDSIMARKEMS